MEDFYDLIEKIIDDENTTIEELKILKQKYPDKADFIDFVIQAVFELPKHTHIPFETLASYAFYLENNESVLKHFDKLRFKLEAHLSSCKQCRDDLNMLREEAKETSNFIDASFSKELSVKESTNFFFRNAAIQYAAAAVIVLAVLYSGLYSFLNFNIPLYKESVSTDVSISVTRGRLTEEFQKSVFAMEEENYSDAIKYLKQDVVNSPNDESVFYSEYLLGLSYLLTSEKSFVGLYRTHIPEKLDSAILHLNHSIEKINNPAFNNIKLNSYYYIGKAYLLKNEIETGKEYLKKVISGKGKYSEKAEKILASLED